MKIKNYDGYGWIKVAKYTMDESKTWEERYKDLEAHHVKETTFLIDEVRKLAEEMAYRDEIAMERHCND